MSMTDEEKIAAETAAAEEKEKADAEFESSLENLTDEEKDAKRSERAKPSDNIDYEALRLEEEERAKKGKPDPEAARLAFEERERKRKEAEEKGEELPLTRAEVEALIAQNNAGTHKTLQEQNALAIARANTSSEAEAQAALAYWRNRVTPSGNLEDDVLFAIGGLNRKVTAAKSAELARALRAKDTTSKNPASTHRDSPQGTEPKLSKDDTTVLQQTGFVWDGVKRLYKKPMGGKKFLYADPKNLKKKWIAS